MNEDVKLLAMLVHGRVVDESSARAALQSGDVGRWLVQNGRCTSQQWQEWKATAGGTRPQLARYELGDLLGEGATARVFQATDRTDGRKVALKVLRRELAADKQKVETFVKEAKLLLDLDHPHVVKGLRVAREGETFYFAMEELPGKCLQDLLRESGRMDEEDALAVTAEIASALAALHDKGLVHRDVKPGNVIWSEERGAVLIDLGFAVATSGGAPAGSETTAGTVHYIAPEQARGSGELDVRADIYALGATLYHLTTGSLPFEGVTSEEVLAKQVLESLSGERIRALKLSPQLHYFLEKMMAKEREIRFQNPQQLQREIEAHLAQLRHQREVEEKQQQARPGAGRSRSGIGKRGSLFDHRLRRRRR